MSNGIKTNITPIPSFVTGATRRRLLASRQHPSRSLALKLWVLSTILPCTTTATRLCSWSTRKDSTDVVGACRSLTTPSSSSVTKSGRTRLRSSVYTDDRRRSIQTACQPASVEWRNVSVLSLQPFLHPTALSLLQVSRNYYQSETLYETDC